MQGDGLAKGDERAETGTAVVDATARCDFLDMGKRLKAEGPKGRSPPAAAANGAPHASGTEVKRVQRGMRQRGPPESAQRQRTLLARSREGRPVPKKPSAVTANKEDGHKIKALLAERSPRPLHIHLACESTTHHGKSEAALGRNSLLSSRRKNGSRFDRLSLHETQATVREGTATRCIAYYATGSLVIPPQRRCLYSDSHPVTGRAKKRQFDRKKEQWEN